MANENHIQWLSRRQIDEVKWDAAIKRASQSRIYGLTAYLDGMAVNWDALVAGDYDYIMPLTWNRKWGIKYLYQPPFTQQLGIFSSLPLTEAIMRRFIDEANRRFRFAEIALNASNGALPGLLPKANYVLPLHESYESIRLQYKTDLHKNLKRSAGQQLAYQTGRDLESALNLYEQTYASRTPQVKKEHYTRFTLLCRELQTKDMLLIREVRNSVGELLATGLLLRDAKRIYLVQSTNTLHGRQLEANHFLLDELIREFSNTNLTLDFEGSDIAGIAHFYRNFGSIDEPYFFYRNNQLPWPLNWLK